jgi:hypothetical protein
MDPERKQTGYASETASDQELDLFSVGPGVAYYFEPLGLYLSGTVTLAWMTMDDKNSDDDSKTRRISDSGIGTSLTVGKEWWVSSNWGLGMASMLHIIDDLAFNAHRGVILKFHLFGRIVLLNRVHKAQNAA